MPTFSQSAYIHALKLIDEIRNTDLLLLGHYFAGNFDQAIRATQTQLEQTGLRPKLIQKIIARRGELNISELLLRLSKNNIEIISYVDEGYPQLLQELPDPPALLYYKGCLSIPNELCVAIVGSRRMSSYGQSVTEMTAKELGKVGITIVSGLAYGIDSVAHQTCLTEGTRTIGVVATGLLESDLYPKDHLGLAEHIVRQGGALISEYPPGTPPYKQHFLARNRIIAGLAMGTLVIECAQKSGALITARHALDYNRSVYAVPGSIFSPASEGCNWLLKQGAIPVTTAGDIFADLNIPNSVTEETVILTTNEKNVLHCLQQGHTTLSDLLATTKLDASTLMATLSLLELQKVIKTEHGHYLVSKKAVL